MTKTDKQNRVLAWRLKVLREASAAWSCPYISGHALPVG